MDPQPEMIRQQIDQTRSSLTEKLETLEAEVKGTVQTARETVHDTISSVKETVQSARETVKRTFDVEYQVDQHPWAMLGLSLVSGVAVGALLGPRLRPANSVARRMAEAAAPPMDRAGAAPATAWSRLSHDQGARPGFLDKLGHQLGEELDKAQDLAITTIAGVVSDVVRRSIPAVGSAVEEMMVRAATQCARRRSNSPRNAARARPEPATRPRPRSDRSIVQPP